MLGRSRDGSRFADLEDDPDATPIPGVLIHRFEAALIFANADLFQDDLLARVHAADPRPDTVVLDFEGVGHVDVTGGEALRSLHDTLAPIGTRLIIARAKSSVRGALRRQGIADVVGEDNFARTVARALDADAPALRCNAVSCLGRRPPPGPGGRGGGVAEGCAGAQTEATAAEPAWARLLLTLGGRDEELEGRGRRSRCRRAAGRCP